MNNPSKTPELHEAPRASAQMTPWTAAEALQWLATEWLRSCSEPDYSDRADRKSPDADERLPARWE